MTSTAPDTGQRAARPADDAVEASCAADVARLEERFGDAGDPDNPVGRSAVVAADERGEPPAAGEDLLAAYGLGAHFVPRELGGRFATLEGLVAVMRAVYRRDPALGLGYGAGSFMAAVNVWTAGDREQREWLAGQLLSGERAACAYHELAHGNDLARAEMTALPGPDGRLRLNGRKEVVANLGRARAMVVFARTDPAPGPRSHSQLLLDSAALDAGAVRDLGRFGSSGMRGVRLGGLEFTDCPVPGGSVVGRPGQGLETAARSFQLTRIALPGMTAGLLDTALRTALRGAAGRRLYGATAADLPLVKAVLAESFADLLLTDAMTAVAARTAHTAPAQAGLYASAVKALAPRILMRAVYRLSDVLGSQFYLRSGEPALFQKLLRDVQPSAFGHASRASCHLALLPQLPLAARRTWSADGGAELPAETFRPGGPLPPLPWDRLALTASGRDPLARSLLAGTERAGAGDPAGPAAREWCRELEQLAAAAAALGPREIGPAAPAAAFDLVERWTGVLAAASCLNLWWHRPADTGGLDGATVLAMLHRLGAHLGRHRDPLPAELAEPLHTELLRRFDAGLTFDLGCRATGA